MIVSVETHYSKREHGIDSHALFFLPKWRWAIGNAFAMRPTRLIAVMVVNPS